MERGYRDFGLKFFYLWGDTVTLNVKTFSAFCDELISRKLPVQWFGNARADNLVDPAFVKRLRQAGCWMLALGIETESEETRKDMMKRLEGEKIRKALVNMRAAGIKSFGFFILGYPGETPDVTGSHDRLRRSIWIRTSRISIRPFRIRAPISIRRPSVTACWPAKTGRGWSTRITCSREMVSTSRSCWTRSTAPSAGSILRPGYIVRHTGDIFRLASTKWNLAWHVGSRVLFGTPVTHAAKETEARSWRRRIGLGVTKSAA